MADVRIDPRLRATARGRRRTHRRTGFALVVVLWTIAGTAAAALVVQLAAREAVEGAQNQLSATRAYWSAEACAARLLAIGTDSVIAAQRDLQDPQRAWRVLDRIVPGVRVEDSTARCTAAFESNGARLDLNRASATCLAALVAAIGVPSPQRDSLVDALLDWRDADDLVRPNGAERAWYVAHHRAGPRDGPLADPREVFRIAGFDRLSPGQDTMLLSLAMVDGDAIDLSHAPRVLLEMLPGVSATVADAILAERQADAVPADLMHLMTQLPSPAHDSIAANYAQLITRAETAPRHWVLVAEGQSGTPAVRVRLELLLAGGQGLGIVRRRYWME